MSLRSLTEQLLKFGVVGILATLIDYGILMVLSQAASWDPLPASAVSFTISLIFNYVASMSYVFTRRDDLSRRRELFIFIVLSLAGLAINSALMWAGTELLGDGPVSVTVNKVVTTSVVMLWNFTSRKHWLEAK